MSDRMNTVNFPNLLNWILQEYSADKSIFGIPHQKFFFLNKKNKIEIFDEIIETPIGPAAGPHTQLAQNIVAAYLTGGRFFELKTVQSQDKIEVEKPCIDARDEGYNVEWSQELTLEQSFEEYLKAWFLIYLLNEIFHFSRSEEKCFVFNMSVGYSLDGIKTQKMDNFINNLKDASITEQFFHYKSVVKNEIQKDETRKLLQSIHKSNSEETSTRIEQILNHIDNIPQAVSSSVTLSTMHGCPSDEIESIAKYLIETKRLHTYIKLNPTLLGFDYVKDILNSLGYEYINLDEESFLNDLHFDEAIPMIKRLIDFANKNEREFGVKLSNTLGVLNKQHKLPGKQMYMSGKSLFPLTINLAKVLTEEIGSNLNISFSGGAEAGNIKQIFDAGIYPITVVTDLLKPGGYYRLSEIAKQFEHFEYHLKRKEEQNDYDKINKLTIKSISGDYYKKSHWMNDSIKIPLKLNLFDCFVAPCSVACPIHQDVAEYIRLVEEQRYADAFEVIIAKNPLPHITGYICDHQCMNKCTRKDYDNPVMIREIKKEAAEKGLNDYLKKFVTVRQLNKNGIKVAVIGAGPSGLSSAYFLSKAGFEVTIFERSKNAGGTVQHVIPEFRLPQSAIDNDVEFIKKHGVKIKYGSDEQFSIVKLKESGFEYIYLAIGATNSNKSNLSENRNNIFEAIEFLKDFKQKKQINLGNRVAVIGGGNSAMDSARAALRINNVKKVDIIYRRTKENMPADLEEFDAAVNEGIGFKELLLPVQFIEGTLKCRKMQLGKFGKDGRIEVLPIENKFEEIKVDSVISAIGEHVSTEFLTTNKIELDEYGFVKVNRKTNETYLENVYIGGDALRGPSTVVESIADGRKAADSILDKVKHHSIENILPVNLFDPVKRENDLINRKGVVETQQNIHFTNEADKCLACNFICNKCVEVCPNRANISIKASLINASFRDKYQILHVDALCNECGNCETFCPYEGMPYKDKITIFSNESDFISSTNEGFYLQERVDGAKEIKFKVRFNSEIGTIIYKTNGILTDSTFNGAGNHFETFTKFVFTIYDKYRYLFF